MDDTSQAAPKSPQTTPHAASDHGADALPPTSAPSLNDKRIASRDKSWAALVAKNPNLTETHRLLYILGHTHGYACAIGIDPATGEAVSR